MFLSARAVIAAGEQYNALFKRFSQIPANAELADRYQNSSLTLSNVFFDEWTRAGYYGKDHTEHRP